MQKDSAGFFYKNLTSAATYILKGGTGVLHTVTINKPVASAVISMYDNASAASGNSLGVITLPATLLSNGPNTGVYDIAFENGLVVVITGSPDVTISFA